MHSAFLLVATAWLAAGDPVVMPAAPAIVSAPTGCAGGSCGGGGCTASASSCCDTCDDCCKPSCLQKLFARFHHSKCDTCDTCNTCSTCDTCNTCNTCSKHSHAQPSCGCDACADSCCKESFLKRLFAKFHHKCDTCDTCDSCNTCDGCANGSCGGSYPTTGTIVPSHPAGAAYPSAPGHPITPGIVPAPGITPVPGTMPKAEPIPLPGGKTEANPGKPLPEGAKVGAPTIDNTPVAPKAGEGETKSPFDLDRRYEARVNRAPDFSSVTGQLFFVHADGGLWVLRYAPLWQEDSNGGSVVLARDVRMDSYREGDLVTVKGEILNQQRGSAFLGGPLYRAQSIQLIERDSQ